MMKKLLLATAIATIPAITVAEQTEYRLGGIYLGQDCATLNTTQIQSSVSNPDDWSDKIEVTRSELEKEINEDITLYAYCSVIDNTVYSLILVSTDVTSGTKIQDKFKETLGRDADDKNHYHNKGTVISGEWYPESMSSTYSWNLENNISAGMSSYTNMEKLLGKDRSKLRGLKVMEGSKENKWRVSYRISNNSDKEWKFLKEGGAVSSEEKEDKLIDDLL
jgi:hypothetical protein